jgi:phosphoribosylanthranilate isomerase
MTWVKVCGMTNRDDVVAAAAAGADAVGFVTWAGSPRRVSPEQAAGLGRDLTIARVLVTVHQPADALLAAAATAGVDGVQPGGDHATEAAAAAHQAGYMVLRPVPVGGGTPDLAGVGEGEIPLFDTARPGSHGGTGEAFDWSLAAALDREFVLAGGLGPDNVAAAVALGRPWGVDASSRLEREPGRKDHDLVRRFVTEAKKMRQQQ